MTTRRAKGRPQRSDPAAGALSTEQVSAYLLEHPEFFTEHPDLLMMLAPPARWSGDSVVDLQKFMVDTLREELDGLRNCTQEVIETSRANMTNQTRTHAAVLALLTASDLERFVRIVHDDLTLLLDVDAAALAFEPGSLRGADGLDVQRLAETDVDRWIGRGQEVVLIDDISDDGAVFGAAAGLVRSAALVRLRPGETAPEGMLALGSRHQGMFHPGQGTELLRFLARVVERCLERLLAAGA